MEIGAAVPAGRERAQVRLQQVRYCNCSSGSLAQDHDVLRLARMEKHQLQQLQEVELMRHELKSEDEKKERLAHGQERCGAEGETGVSAGGEHIMHSDFCKSSGTDMETDIDRVEQSTSPVLAKTRSCGRPCS